MRGWFSIHQLIPGVHVTPSCSFATLAYGIYLRGWWRRLRRSEFHARTGTVAVHHQLKAFCPDFSAATFGSQSTLGRPIRKGNISGVPRRQGFRVETAFATLTVWLHSRGCRNKLLSPVNLSMNRDPIQQTLSFAHSQRNCLAPRIKATCVAKGLGDWVLSWQSAFPVTPATVLTFSGS